jgi:hypothetical protein
MRRDTLLMDFILRKLQALPPDPVRKGKRKGEAIGPSRKKKGAAIVSLLKIPYNQIAEATGAKVTSVTIWKGQEDFRAMTEDYAQEFLEVLKPRVIFASEAVHKGQKIPEFADSDYYSPFIVSELYKWALRPFDMRIFRTVMVLFGSPKTSMSGLRSIVLEMVNNALETLKKPVLSRKEKTRIEEALNLVKIYLETEKKGE